MLPIETVSELNKKPVMVALAIIPVLWKTEAGVLQIKVLPGLLQKTLSQRKKKKKCQGGLGI